jgi:pimeloyl-ACP methyl ester carboxylesterase
VKNNKKETEVRSGRELVKVGGLAVEHFIPPVKRDSIPILFCHGLGGGSWIWSNFSEYFSNKGWDTFAMNYRGHYLSDTLEHLESCQFMDYVDDVQAVIKHLGKDPYLFGHSLGGMVVQKYAERKNPAKLFLIDSGTCKALTDRLDRDTIMKKMQELGSYIEKDGLIAIPRDPQKIKKIFFAEGMVEEEVLQEFVRKQSWESKQAVMMSAITPVDQQKIRCPVYVMGKEKGYSTGMPTNRWLADYYQARKIKTGEPMGHCFMKEKNWEVYAKILEHWLLETS